MPVRLIPTLLAILLLAAACSSEPSDSSSSLAVLDGGNVVVMGTDGSDVVRLTEGPGEYFQPVWSPDGEKLAFSRVGADPGVDVALVDERSVFGSDTATGPFYVSWSPDNDIALLRTGGTGFVLEWFDVGDGSLSDAAPIDSGQPLYFSWSPDGDSVTTHVGADRLDTSRIGEAGSDPADIDPGTFQAPRWTDRGIFAVERGVRDQRLVVIATDGEATAVATLPGQTTFVATDKGDKVAIQSTVQGGNGLNASLQSLPNLAANRLVVADLEEQTLTPITSDPVLAYFWSPTGDRLLILDVVEGPQTRWSVWSGDEVEEVVSFDPEPSFMSQMVPFFDQYAQSMSLWAPDGTAFAFPGTVEGEQGIWVSTIAGEPRRVASGTWVSWSP